MASIESSNVDSESSEVADFYSGKSVFITGGTGFLGKVIIEKLLYSCPQIGNVYILVRDQNNLAAQYRLERLLEIPLFDRLRDKNPGQLKKIVPVTGDMVLPNLGIMREDEAELSEKVSVVIHTAANLKSKDRLKDILDVNYEGTRRVMDLCRIMKKIQVFLYVSTAYTNAQNEVIEEKLSSVTIDVNDLYEKLKRSSKSGESKLLCGYPNPHVFTKALSERLVMEKFGDIPTIVVKPSIVTPSKSEPIEGWVDNLFGVTALLANVGRGFCRAMISRRENILDVIPVDYVANLIIVAVAKCHTSKNIEVFNSCSTSVNPITIGEISDLYIKENVRNRYNVVPFPKVLMTKCRWLYWIVILFTEIIPAYIADFCLIQFGNLPKFIKIQSQVSTVRNATEYYTRNSWIIKNGNASALAASLSPRDAVMFPIDPSDISWPNYMTAYFNGVKRFLIDSKVKQ